MKKNVKKTSKKIFWCGVRPRDPDVNTYLILEDGTNNIVGITFSRKSAEKICKEKSTDEKKYSYKLESINPEVGYLKN